MRKLITGAMAAVTLGGATLATAGAASARPWGHYHRGYGGGALVGAGLLGLAAGVALTDRPRYYGAPAYYGRPYARGYYAPAYYGRGYGYGEACRTVFRWDPYVGHRVPVQRCW